MSTFSSTCLPTDVHKPTFSTAIYHLTQTESSEAGQFISMTFQSSPPSASLSYSVCLTHILKFLYYACVYYIINYTIHSIARLLSIYYSSIVSLVIIVIIYTTTPDFTAPATVTDGDINTALFEIPTADQEQNIGKGMRRHYLDFRFRTKSVRKDE
jgi:hypothetical protein